MCKLRIHDCEYLDVRAWIIDAQQGNTFDFQFDADDPDTRFVCYLDEPMLKDGYEPKRMPNWPNIWEFDLVIRTIGVAPIYVSSSGLCGATGGVTGS